MQLLGLEAGGIGNGLGQNAASIAYGTPGVLQGTYSLLLQDENGQIQETHSVSAGLDYPGVGPEHALLQSIGRVQVRSGRRRRRARGAGGMLCRRRHSAGDRIVARAGGREALRASQSGQAHSDRPFGSRRQRHADVARTTFEGTDLMTARDSDQSRRFAAPRQRGTPAIVAYITAGFPTKRNVSSTLLNTVASAADVVEIGVPFTDPMADGTTIQRSSRAALEQGVSLRWILADSPALSPKPQAPLLLMSYLNPLLAYGLDKLPQAAAEAGIAGFIVPDLPFEECDDLRRALEAHGIALVQFVTPVTPTDRMQMLCEGSGGIHLCRHDDGHDGQERRRAAGSARLLCARESRIAGAGVRGLRHSQSRTGRAHGAVRRRCHRRLRAGRGHRARRGSCCVPARFALT